MSLDFLNLDPSHAPEATYLGLELTPCKTATELI